MGSQLMGSLSNMLFRENYECSLAKGRTWGEGGGDSYSKNESPPPLILYF